MANSIVLNQAIVIPNMDDNPEDWTVIHPEVEAWPVRASFSDDIFQHGDGVVIDTFVEEGHISIVLSEMQLLDMLNALYDARKRWDEEDALSGRDNNEDA